MFMANKKNSKIFIIGILSLVIIACVGAIIFYYYRNNKASSQYQSIQEIAYSSQGNNDNQQPQQENIPINFEALKVKNPDIYSWIRIPDTAVDYPILQSTSDPEDFYLNHTVDRTSGLPGAIYTRMNNAKDFSDTNTVIYGHNMKDGSMFKGLHKYEDKSYFDGHPYVYIYTPDKSYKYEIFAAVTYSDVLLSSAFDFSTERGLLDFVESLKNTRNMTDQIKESVEIKEGDKLITLSTCIAGKPNNRYIVVAVLRNEE